MFYQDLEHASILRDIKDFKRKTMNQVIKSESEKRKILNISNADEERRSKIAKLCQSSQFSLKEKIEINEWVLPEKYLGRTRSRNLNRRRDVKFTQGG